MMQSRFMSHSHDALFGVLLFVVVSSKAVAYMTSGLMEARTGSGLFTSPLRQKM